MMTRSDSNPFTRCIVARRPPSADIRADVAACDALYRTHDCRGHSSMDRASMVVVSCQQDEGMASEEGCRECTCRSGSPRLDRDVHVIRAPLGRYAVRGKKSLRMPDLHLVHSPQRR